MSLTTITAADVLAACEAGSAETIAALNRALDGKFTLQPTAGSAIDNATLPSSLSGAGLLVVLTVGEAAAVVALPETTRLLPAWYSAPDATGVSKLATLAQELGMLLLPEAEMPDDFAAFPVSSLSAALERGVLAKDAQAIALELASAGQTGTAHLIWPLAQPKALAEPAPTVATPAPAAAAPAARAPAAKPAPAAPAMPRYESLEAALPAMPSYTRSLLKIEVPIVVTLARSKQPVSRIVELAPGSIIPFAKSCDDSLSLEVNNCEVAVGEAVKVGDKFGLRITAMTMPPEKFVALKGRRAS